MEEQQDKKGKLQAIYQGAKDSVFNIMQELLKNKKSGKWFTCFLMLIMILQLIAFLFDTDNNFKWEDEFLLDAFTQICDFARLLPTIQKSNSASFYWMLYFTGIVGVFFIIGLFAYIHYCISVKKYYFTWPLNLLRTMLVFLYWVLYSPIFESFASIYRCEGGKHFIDRSMTCYDSVHIVFMVLSAFFSVLIFVICFVTALMYHETQPVKEDALARLENNFEVVFLFYRTTIILFSTFIYNEITNWIFISVFMASSILFLFQYFKYVPYFNRFVSIFWGTLITCYAWVSLNALLMMLIETSGHLLVICIGVPLLAFLVKNLRKKRIERLLLVGLDKIKTDTDALIQIQTLQRMIADAKATQTEDPVLIGYVNLHVVECQNMECPCKTESELYDATTGKFSQRNVGSHKDGIFLNHLNKRLYEDTLNKFINSPRLHIAFSFFLFDSMKNVHASLVELDIASKKKPSIHQQFTIFRNKGTIENYIKADSNHAKDIYSQLTNVIEFERLYVECQKGIERVCTHQIEFWTQLSGQMPDMNLLHDFATKIYDGTKEAEEFWSKLCKINSNYPKALNLYGNYMSQVKNNDQLGYELLDKAKANANKKSLDELVKSSDILFADDTVVIHISGNKETAGRIVKTNQGLSKIFGYTKSEVMGHFVNILMPSIFAKRHNEFLEKFFRTGRKTMFNQERYMYALHRSGCCFQIKIMLKQMPSLVEGIQYVAMIRQSQADYDYIITDMRGVIDCFSQGVSSLLKLPANLFKDSEINVQILAPELIKVFSSVDKRRTLLEKFKEAGGQKLLFMVPRDFAANTQGDSKKTIKDLRNLGASALKMRREHKSRKKTGEVLYREINKDMNKHGGIASKPISPRSLIQSTEYRECENKQTVRCEIQDLTFGEVYKDFDPLKLRVFKLSGITNKAAAHHIDLSSDAGELVPPSHSGASFDWKDPRAGGISSRGDLVRHPEDSKGILDYILHNGPMLRGVGKGEENKSEAGGSRKSDAGGEREDTKVTEKLPGNVMTTESRLDTYEAKSGVKVKYAQDPITGELKKVIEAEAQPKEEEKVGTRVGAENKKDLPFSNTLEKQKLGEESAHDSESRKSTGRAKQTFVTGQQDTASGNFEADKKKGQATPSSESRKSKSPASIEKLVDNSADPQTKAGEYESNPFGYIGGESDHLSRVDEQKEENEESPLAVNKARSPQKKNVRVPSMLDETLDAAHRRSLLEVQRDVEAQSHKPIANVFIDNNRDLELEEAGHLPKDFEVKSLPPVPPLKIRQNSRDTGELDSQYQQNFDRLSKASERDYRALGIMKKPSKTEERRVLLHEKRSIKQIRRKYHSKIITNPKYEDAEDDIKELAEYRPGDEEIKLRRALLANEKKKRHKEKKKGKRDKKKRRKRDKDDDDKSDNDTSKADDKSDEEKKDDEESEESEEDDSSDDDENQETQSSVTSGSTGSTIRSFYSLRAAIDEKFTPPSIRNLRCTANIVFLLLLSLAIVYFVMQTILFSKINQNIKNIRYSENRLNYLFDINLHTTKMMLITADYKLRLQNPNLSPEDYVLHEDQALKNRTFEESRDLLRTAATELKNTQTELSLKTAGLSKSSLESINPEDVALDYKPVEGMPKGYDYTIWQAMMEVVVSSFRIATMDIDQVDDSTDSTVYFVTKNSLNGILINLQKSTQAIIDETESSRKTNVFIFLLLLCGASLALVVSTGMLIPVIKKVKMNKQDVLELFMSVKKPDIDEEITKCKKFFSTLQANQETELNIPEQEEAKDGGNDQEGADNQDARLKKMWERGKGGARKHKRFKRLAVGLGMVAFKFSFILILMEGYFLMTYFLSTTFLNRVSSLTTEISQLISRLPTHGLFLLVVENAIFKNYTTTIMNEDVDTFIQNYQNQLYIDEDKLLDTFSNNHDYHTDHYNENFNTIIFSNLCPYINELQKVQNECEQFNQGILQKGVYSSVIKYWDYLRQLNHDFKQSARSPRDQHKFLNDPGLKVAEKMESFYFNIALNKLIDELQSDIDEFFTSEVNRDRILFIVYIGYLVVVYLFIWLSFVNEMQEELWKTKSVLSILHPEVIMAISEIKNYILSNSSTVFFSKAGRK